MVTPLPEMLTSGGLLTVATHSLTAPLAHEGPLPKGSGSRGIGLSELEVCPFESEPQKLPGSRNNGKIRRKY